MVVALLVISIPVAWVLSWVFQKSGIAALWWLDTPAVLGVFGLLYAAFNKLAWHWKVFRTCALVQTPDLRGVWRGTVTTSHDGQSDRHEVSVRIKQSWTHIRIELEGAHSTSQSQIAMMHVGDEGEVEVAYEYLNEPKANAASTMHSHRGFARLKVTGEVAEGDYYSGRDRQTHGTLLLKLEKVAS